MEGSVIDENESGVIDIGENESGDSGENTTIESGDIAIGDIASDAIGDIAKLENTSDPAIKELLTDAIDDANEKLPIDLSEIKVPTDDITANDLLMEIDEVTGELFIPEVLNRNSTSFPLKLKESFNNIMSELKKGTKLSIIQTYFKYYQLLTYNYFNWMIRSRVTTDLNGNNYIPKGLLISYTMGGGKTAVAVGCALAALKTKNPPKKIIVMLLKSLQENFIKNIVTILDKIGMVTADINTFIKTNFKFVAFNASNMVKQLFEDDSLVDMNLLEILQNSSILENSMIIVDEYHLLGRAITNGSKNGQAFYSAVMKTPNVKLMFLTGSIISNNSFELAICYNLLAGMELFPTDYNEFRRIFCTEKGHLKAEMRGKFQNRIVGLTSYIGIRDVQSEDVGGENYTPELRKDIILKVKMTDFQTGLYIAARRKENEEISFTSGKAAPNLTKPKSENTGTYRQRSRQLSNYAPQLDGRITEKNASSPKFEAISEKLKLSGTHLIYSQYVGIGGLGALRVFLRGLGYVNWQMENASKEELKEETLKENSKETLKEEILKDSIIDDNQQEDNTEEEKTGSIADEILVEDEPVKFNPLEVPIAAGNHDDAIAAGNLLDNEVITAGNHDDAIAAGDVIDIDDDAITAGDVIDKYTYALFTGDETAEVRNEAIRIFNLPENINGDIIKILMISSAGALGIDLKNCRYVHVMEPYWSEERLLQVRSRALRLNAHKDLPPDQRFVQSFIYEAFPMELANVDKELLGSTDEEIYMHAKIAFEANETFLTAIHETCIECPMNDDNVCRMCAPTDQPLFTRDIVLDMRAADNCVAYQKSEVDVKETIIEIDGKPIDVFYKVDTDGRIEGFIKDLNIGAHRKLRHGERLYELLLEYLK